ncbi:MAG: NAD(P)-dependent oxidoreductase [Actinomycetota bacterium]|nr:MAG: dTDP-glucose 4 [Actinomycetota bacterium]MDO8950807.1 NAD(P)-dependent oxidoreductase [Actinomycetota bacterium]MDP3629937.1 NAD(P)-dependent oxidoreductase [Actinomycetota bacterium]
MSPERRRIAVLGATGHVGKCLTAALLEGGKHEVTAVARNEERLADFLDALPHGEAASRSSFDDFPKERFDAVVNCVGVGAPADRATLGASVVMLTEQIDAIVAAYLKEHPEALHIGISSGAAYCSDFTLPASAATPCESDCREVIPGDEYGAAKRDSEARHREAAADWIVDLRLFGLFSRFADLDARYLMSDVCRAILQGDVLKVSADEVVRDYVDPGDFAALLEHVIEADRRNDVFDVYSAAPTGKFEMLETFSDRYGLRFEVSPEVVIPGATGIKPNYYSVNHKAGLLGYEPRRTSLQALISEADALLAAAGHLLP